MKKGLFGILSKYQALKDISPEENFTTEILVFLLNYSLRNKTILLSAFMNEILGTEYTLSQYPDLSVISQRAFITLQNNKAFPDITIEDKKKELYYFIEVKIESGINYYLIEDKENKKILINQIQKYQSIATTKIKRIYLLTKYPCIFELSNKANLKELRWYQIYNFLNKYFKNQKELIEKFLINEFIKYLEEKEMAIPKVSYELMRGVDSLNNLFKQIEIILESIPYKSSFGQEWWGYYLYLTKDKKDPCAWVGTYYDGTKLTYECYNKEIVESFSNNFSIKFELSNNKKHYETCFDFEKERYFCLSPDEQLDLLKEWIMKIYNILCEYSKS